MTDKQKRDAAVDAFALAIKTRLDAKASQGFTGWDGNYPAGALAVEMLDDATRVYIHSERPLTLVDIGARAMMLHFRSSNAPRDLRGDSRVTVHADVGAEL